MKTTKNVGRGVALLDERVPGWEHRVKLDKLDLSSMCSCVCGQIVTRQGAWHSRFRHGLAVLGVEPHLAYRYGFSVWGQGSFTKLTDEWTRVIRAKRRGEEITS